MTVLAFEGEGEEKKNPLIDQHIKNAKDEQREEWEIKEREWRLIRLLYFPKFPHLRKN